MIERASIAGIAERPFADDPPGLHLLALQIDAGACPSWRTHLAAHGHPVVDETPYTLYLQDPEGNRVGLSSWPHPLT